jgi:AMP nucleosidase
MYNPGEDAADFAVIPAHRRQAAVRRLCDAMEAAEEFRALVPDAAGPAAGGIQMPAWHHVLPDKAATTVVCIGVGPSNAKTITDHLAVLRPDLMLMAGHCGGLRDQQDIGDFVLASAYLRDDRILDEVLPPAIPVMSSPALNTVLLHEIGSRGLRSRPGIVYSTADRNWEMHLSRVEERLRLSRAVTADMESATVAANGYRYKIPAAALLKVSDRPLHGRPKLAGAVSWAAASARQQMEIAVAAAGTVRKLYPDGLPPAGLAEPGGQMHAGAARAAGAVEVPG